MAEVWAASGAMALTGRVHGPGLNCPRQLIARLWNLRDRISSLTARLGQPVALPVVEMLGERAAFENLSRRGSTSCGGASRLLPCRDGWVAVTMARLEDRELIPAWTGNERGEEEPWDRVAAFCARQNGEQLVAGATLLGLAVSRLGEVGNEREPVKAYPRGGAPTRLSLDGMIVVDLSSLWAGPLCSHTLRLAGARVIKVESTLRPDGARFGNPDFFHLLNEGKESVALNFASDELRRLIARADVVIEASRPRALQQLGIDANEMVATGPSVWLSMTSHGREHGHRLGFGDDAAVAGGLVATDGEGPLFLADAIADPLAGLTGAAAVLDALDAGGRWLLDLSMAGVAAGCAGAAITARADAVAPPRARPCPGRAAWSGQHTASVLKGLLA